MVGTRHSTTGHNSSSMVVSRKRVGTIIKNILSKTNHSGQYVKLIYLGLMTTCFFANAASDMILYHAII